MFDNRHSIFFDTISAASTLGGFLAIIFAFNLYIQFDVAYNHSMVTSKVDLVDDCYLCDDIWPVC